MPSLPRTLLAPLLLALSAGASAQAPVQDDRPVSAVRIAVRGDVKVDESAALAYVSTEPGRPASARTISQDVRALLDSGRFTYVDAGVEPSPDGPQVVFTVEGRPRLAADPTFVGLDVFSRSTLRKEANLREGDLVDETLARAAAERIRALYRQERRFDAKVSAALSPAPGAPGSVLLVFTIEEGPYRPLEFLAFPGAEAISEDDLGRFAQLHDWFNPQSWFMTPRISETDLDAVAADARRQYLDAGYLDASVAPPRTELVDGGRRVRVSYDVVEGAVYHVGSISFEGVTLFPEEALRADARLRPGDVAGAAAMEAARTAVRDHYASRGYPDTEVELSTTPGPDHTVALAFRVTEGGLVRVRNVRIGGNVTTKDKVIRREIGLNPGDPYDTVQADLSRRRLMNLGYFEDVRQYDAVVEKGVRDVFYDVDETSTGNVSLGAGFSSVDHVVGMFGISQSNFDIANWHNFKGAGQKARLDLTVARDATDLDVSFVEPWFLDRRLSLDVDLFIRNRGYNEYEERRAGGSVGLAKMVPWVGRVGLEYGLEHVSLDDVTRERFLLAEDPSREFSFLDEDDGYLLGSLRLSWTYDTRDNFLVPHRGTRATAHAKLYNAAFGSAYDFYELNARAYTYFECPFGTVLSLSGRIATVDGIGGDDVPIGSRYFLGGTRYVRGFRHRALGPKALSQDYEGAISPIGGQSLLWATAEYAVPILEQIRFALFYDVGNVWTDAYDFSFDELASSYGFGLRFDFAQFPIRLDYATVLEDPDEWARHRRFVFWIGFDN